MPLLRALLLALPALCVASCETTSRAPAGLQYVSTYDAFFERRDGVRISVDWDAPTGSFTASIWNERGRTIKDVRVELWTDSGDHLGPTPAVVIGPRDGKDVRIETDVRFDAYFRNFAVRWTWLDGMAGFGER